MDSPRRPLAVITGASSGIGFELAVQCARRGFDLVLAADRPLHDAISALRAYRGTVEGVQADLSREAGVDQLAAALGDRVPEALLANAGVGIGRGFLDHPFDEQRRVIDTNVTGTLCLVHRLLPRMRERRRGRVMLTGSIAGYMPGSFNATYNASKAFIDSFALALRDELAGTGITVTCLMPGATDTGFFARAGMLDTRLAAQRKDDPATVARLAIDAMLEGRGVVVTGLRSKLQRAAARVMPTTTLAALHRMMAKPGRIPSRRDTEDPRHPPPS